jgi:dihydrodipicolinate synthase/N-acetylneuraminate lyase
VLAQLTSRYHQVTGIRATNATPGYLIAIKDAITRDDMRYYAILANAPTALALGVDGIFGSKANLIPRTIRTFMDLCDTGDYRRYGPAYVQLMRLHSHVMQWHPAGARWIKMGMRVLGLPGGQGGPRPPYLMPVDDLPRFTAGLLALGIPEIDELLAAAGA